MNQPSKVLPKQRLELLLLCDDDGKSAGTIAEHIQAFPRFSRHRIHVLSSRGDLPEGICLDRFDGLIIHYSLVVSFDSYVSPAARSRIREFRGFKAVFVQDDYRWINDTVSALSYLRINALFPLVQQDIMEAVYPASRLLGVRKETVLAGYVTENLVKRQVPSFLERPIDVGYRARKLPAWLGEHTLQKWQIAERFIDDARRYQLRVDISCREQDRIYGEGWIDFVASCKAMLGTESGASVCDFTGNIQRNVERHLRRHPDASFEELRRRYFADVDGKIRMPVISPRCFEMASLRTLMILYEGDYSQILQPWRHYVPLKLDHSNMDQIVRHLREPALAEPIVERAHAEIALNAEYGYRALVNLVDRVIEEEFQPHMCAVGPSYTDPEFDWARRSSTIVPALKPQSAFRFHPGYGLDQAVDGPAHLNYAAGLEGQPLPHRLDVRLAHRAIVGLVSIDWGDAHNRASSFSVQSLLSGRITAERHISDNRSAHVDVELAQSEADRIRVVIHTYNGVPRLLLRRIQVYASPPGASAALRLLRWIWRMVLRTCPAAIRSRLVPRMLPLIKKLRPYV